MRRLARKRLEPKPQTHGRTPSEAERAAKGQGRLTLRLPVASLAKLDAMARVLGHSRSRVIEHLIKLADRSRPQNEGPKVDA